MTPGGPTTLAAALPQAAQPSVVAVLMTQLRRSALRDPSDARLASQVRRGARDAAVLRATIAACSLVLVALGVVIAT